MSEQVKRKSEDQDTFGLGSIPEVYQEDWRPSRSLQISKSLNISVIKSTTHCIGFQTVEAALKNEHSYWNTKEKGLNRNINQLCYLYVIKALYDLGWTPEVGKVLQETDFHIASGLQRAFRHYMSYLEQENILEGNTHILKRMPPTVVEVEQDIKQLVEVELNQYGPIEIIHAFGSKLASLLQDKLRGRDILYGKEEDGSTYAELFYQQTRFHFGMFQAPAEVFLEIAQQLWSVSSKCGRNNRQLRVLEVGSGTGNFTAEVVPRMKKLGIHFQYVFADISHLILSRVQRKLGSHGGQLEFKVMNIENDPMEQGFPPNYFDLVVGVHAFHTTAQLKRTMSNVMKLLKRGGMLVMGEMEVPVREFDICFGTLENYWLFQDTQFRQTHYTVNSNVWRRILGDVGFKTSEVYDMHLHQGQISVMAARYSGRFVQDSTEREWIMIQSDQNRMFNEFRMRMEKLGRKVINRKFSEIVSNAKEGRDSQTEVEKIMAPIRDTLEGVVFWYDKIQDLEISEPQSRQLLEPLLCVSKFLGRCGWKRVPKLHLISGGVNSIRPNDVPGHCDVDNALLLGFMRVLRVEMPHIHSKCIELKFTVDVNAGLVYDRIFNELWTNEDNEREILIANQYRQVRRLVPEEEGNEKILKFPSNRYSIELPESKKLNDLKYVPQKALEVGELGDNQVEVLVKSASLSFKDVHAVKMFRPVIPNRTPTVGQDFAGVVCRVGGNNRNWRVGDPVFGFSWKQSTITSHLVTDADMIERIPNNMTFNEAATLPTAFQIAWHCLKTLAEMREEQSVLIHAASGGVGLACIQLAKCLNLRIIGTAGMTKKRNFLKFFGIPHVFDCRTFQYYNNIMKVTGGQGVDVVFNSLTGDKHINISKKCCKTHGHFLELAKSVVWAPDQASKKRADVKYHKVDMASLPSTDLIYMMKQLINLLRSGRFKPLPYCKYSAAKIVNALNLLHQAKHIGKVVVEMPEMDSLSGELREANLFNERSSYVITGGLESFGLAVAKWMLDNGAKFIILVDKSPPNRDRAHRAMIELNELFVEKRANVIFRQLDISVKWQCLEFFENFCQREKDIPPIRGVHHCCGGLFDRLIVDESWENFEAVLVPKVNAAWNLHEATKHLPLEFFVVHYSTAGVFGIPGRCSYAAANCYMNNLIKARRVLNLPGMSVFWADWKAGLASNLHLNWLEPYSIQNGLKALETLMRENKLSVVIGNLGKFPEVIDIFPKYEPSLFEIVQKNKERKRKNMKEREENRPKRFKLFQQKTNGAGEGKFSEEEVNRYCPELRHRSRVRSVGSQRE